MKLLSVVEFALMALVVYQALVIRKLAKMIEGQNLIIKNQQLTIEIFKNLMAMNANDMLEASTNEGSKPETLQ